MDREKRERYRELNNGLDPWPKNRPMSINVIETPGATYVVNHKGERLLIIPPYHHRLEDLGRAVIKIAEAVQRPDLFK